MDYWHKVDVREYDNFSHFIESIHGEAASCPGQINISRNRIHIVETGGNSTYTSVKYNPNDYIIFGSETTGLPASIVDEYRERVVSIPMIGDSRSLNLSVAVGIVLYEALRQGGFAGLSIK